ncbi:MAG: hypothetical protein V9F82_06190 [Dermatophilaceae bacterium]
MPDDATDTRFAQHSEEPDLRADSRRTFALVGVLVVLAIALVVAGWQVATAGTPQLRGGSTVAATRVEPTAEPTRSARPAETFVVPAPSFATPSLAEPLGPMVPMVEQAPAAQPAPVAAPAPAPAPAPAAKASPPPAIKVSAVKLRCEGSRGRVTAALSFTSTAPVAVSLTAGDRTETTTAGGDVSLSVESRRTQSATCSAVVNGAAVGPVPAT